MTVIIMEHMTIIMFARHRHITKRDITRVMSMIIAVLFSGQEHAAGILVQPANELFCFVVYELNIIICSLQKYDVLIVQLKQIACQVLK
jgi:hypothetical protein